MKPEILKKPVMLILVPAIALFSSAQIVNRPDTGFKNALIEGGVDTCGDEEISCAEAEVMNYLDISRDRISDIRGTDNILAADMDNTAESISLFALDGTTVTINRDYFGVPHIVAESEAG